MPADASSASTPSLSGAARALFTRSALAWRDASHLRAATSSLRQELDALGLLAPARPAADDRTRAADPRTAPIAAEVYRAIFRKGPTPCVCSDGRGVVCDVNEAAARLFNVPERRLVGKPLLHFVARADTRRFREIVRAVEGADGEQSLTVHIRPRGGHPAARSVRVARLGAGSYAWFFEEPAERAGGSNARA